MARNEGQEEGRSGTKDRDFALEGPRAASRAKSEEKMRRERREELGESGGRAQGARWAEEDPNPRGRTVRSLARASALESGGVSHGHSRRAAGMREPRTRWAHLMKNKAVRSQTINQFWAQSTKN